MPTRVIPIKQATIPDPEGEGPRWQLYLQWVRYLHESGDVEHGYRFIWRRPDGSLQAARGQARIPSLHHARQLMKIAEDEGWGEEKG